MKKNLGNHNRSSGAGAGVPPCPGRLSRALFATLVLVPAFARHASAGAVVVETLRADEVRTREISALPEPQTDAELHYAFERDTGSLVVDSGSGGHDATAASCAWSVDGPFNGGAMSFSGNNSKIPVPAAPNFPTWNQYSASVWFLHDGGGDHGPNYGHKIIDKTSMYHDWYIRVQPDTTPPGQLCWVMHESSASVYLGAPPARNYMDNAWHHVVMVRDGANGSLWVDGVLTNSKTNMFSVYSSSGVCVGNSLSSDSYQRKGWSGKLDEVMIFDRPLSPDEIQTLYQQGSLVREPLPPITVSSDMSVGGKLTVSGETTFEGGVRHVKPLGDLSPGIYTNALKQCAPAGAGARHADAGHAFSGKNVKRELTFKRRTVAAAIQALSGVGNGVLARNLIPAPQGGAQYSEPPAPSDCFRDSVAQTHFENAGARLVGMESVL